jgi:hypothetical protein
MTKREIKAILTKGNITGKEAGALIIRHFVETDHQRPAILSGAEIQQLRARVRKLTEQDMEDFNSWLDLYRITGFTLKEAEVLYLKILLALSTMEHLLQPFMEWRRIAGMASFIPYCVTEKQLQDLKDRRLQRLHCMAEVIDARAGNLSEGQWWSAESSEEQDAAILEQATREIMELLEKHKLEPVRLEERADETEREDIKRCPFDLGEPEWLCLYLTGEQLYQTGLPEWQRSIDRYSAAEEIGCSVKRLRSLAFEVAIVQDPIDDNLDENGWYEESWLEQLTLLPALSKAKEEHGFDICEKLQERHRGLRRLVRVFLAHQPVYEALSELIGVKLHEDLEAWLAEIKEAVEHYNEQLESPGVKPPPDRMERFEELRPDLPPFTIEDLKPDRRHVQHLKERMAMALTAEDQFATFDEWLRERCAEIDETEDALAEEVSGHED